METASMTRKPQKSREQLRTERIERKFAGKTDRQLLEEQTYLIELSTHHINKIKKTANFFLWLALITIAVWIVINIMTVVG